jgi:hypothetical protein
MNNAILINALFYINVLMVICLATLMIILINSNVHSRSTPYANVNAMRATSLLAISYSVLPSRNNVVIIIIIVVGIHKIKPRVYRQP